jgi:hypothetical protein
MHTLRSSLRCLRLTTLTLLALGALYPLTASAEGAGCHITCEAMCEEGGEYFVPGTPLADCMAACKSGCDEEPTDSDAPDDPEVDDAARCRDVAMDCTTTCEASDDPKCHAACMSTGGCGF